MLVYLDLCCLKRPFDDQSQPRIRLESEAVLALLAAESAELQFVRSPALDLENSLNPLKERASRVAQWLAVGRAMKVDEKVLEARTAELMLLGFQNFDALHIASAELSGAQLLATSDDKLLAVARRNSDKIRVMIDGVVKIAHEVLK